MDTHMSAQATELVADPVSHISISGVHGRDELNERLANAPVYRNGQGNPLTTLLLGAAIGAAAVFVLRR